MTIIFCFGCCLSLLKLFEIFILLLFLFLSGFFSSSSSLSSRFVLSLGFPYSVAVCFLIFIIIVFVYCPRLFVKLVGSLPFFNAYILIYLLAMFYVLVHLLSLSP